LATGQGIVMHFLNLRGDIHLHFGVNQLVVRFSRIYMEHMHRI